MSYPQPDSNIPVLKSQNFFRLTTSIVSAGDIYESQQGGQAFAIGPDSDIARAKISYFDPQNSPTFMSSVEITPERLFSGLIPARNEPGVVYLPASRQARILIYPTDNWDPNYFPVGFSNLNDRLFRYNPILDVIEFFTGAPDLAPARNDRVYNIQNVGNNAGHLSWYLFPAYGRSWAMISFTNRNGVDAITYEVRGVNFTIEDGFPNVPQAQETQLVASGAVANNGNNTKIVKSSSDGEFDAFAVGFNVTTVGTPIVFKMILSDLAR